MLTREDALDGGHGGFDALQPHDEGAGRRLELLGKHQRTPREDKVLHLPRGAFAHEDLVFTG